MKQEKPNDMALFEIGKCPTLLSAEGRLSFPVVVKPHLTQWEGATLTHLRQNVSSTIFRTWP